MEEKKKEKGEKQREKKKKKKEKGKEKENKENERRKRRRETREKSGILTLTLSFLPSVSGLVNIGIQTTLTDTEFLHLLSLTQLKAIVCSESTKQKLASVLSSVTKEKLSCASVIVFGDEEETAVQFPSWVTVTRMADVEKIGLEILSRSSVDEILYSSVGDLKQPPLPSQIFTLIFTSGSTGVPKVLSSHPFLLFPPPLGSLERKERERQERNRRERAALLLLIISLFSGSSSYRSKLDTRHQ